MNYFDHLVANWRVAMHSLGDTLEHFLHGLLPFISWEHKQKMREGASRMTERELKRALWLARAMRSEGMLRFFALALNMEQCKKWEWVERKCLEKVEEYK